MLERGELGVAMQGFLAEYDLLVTPSTALPAFAAGVEYPEPERPERWSEWAELQLPVQPDPAAGDQPALRLHRRGLPIGLQLVAAQVCRRAGAARGPGVRGGLPAAHARSTARGRGLTWLRPHAWLAPAAPVRRAKDPEGGDFHAIVHQGHRARRRCRCWRSAPPRRPRRWSSARRAAPKGFSPHAVHRRHHVRRISKPIYNRLIEFERGDTKTMPGARRELHGLRRRPRLHLQAAPGREVAHARRASRRRVTSTPTTSCSRSCASSTRTIPINKVSGGTYEYFASMDMGNLLKSVEKVDDHHREVHSERAAGAVHRQLSPWTSPRSCRRSMPSR